MTRNTIESPWEHWLSLRKMEKLFFCSNEVRPDIDEKCKKLSIFRCGLFKLVAIVDLNIK